ncbi:MAG: MobF family relaxase, partial [Acidimicrobiales bacterium]
MLGLAKMAPAAWRYYASQVALGLEDYFTGRGEAPGHWTGSGAAALGLVGEVDPAHLGALFGQGRHPVTGDALGTPWDHRSTDRVAGYSLSLSPPKSVSVLWGLGTPGVAAEVAAAHQAAVAAAVRLLEDHAAFSRAGKAGVFQVDTEGLVVASFVHRTSRAVDPDLHTHLLVSNKVRCADGRWRALDGREVFAMQKPAGSVYQAAIRAELSARLGVEWEPVDRNGQADIVGVPEGLCRMFSTRRRQIEVRGAERVAAAEARLGRSLTDEERAEAFQVATLETRPAKGGVAEATLSLLERWRAMAVEAGWAPERWLAKALGRSPAQRSLARDAGADVVAQVVAELGEQRSTWGRTDAIKAMARRLPPGLVATAEEARVWIEAGTDAVVAHRQIVRLVAPASVEVSVALCRRDGLATTQRHGGARFTLALEASVIEAAGRGREAGRAVASATAIDAAVADRGLGADQAVAVRRVCGGGEALVCLVGPAGAG